MKVAGAPISWGVCEVPGWGVQLEPDRVLGEMAALGIEATELGPQGWLPADAGPALERHGLRLVGAFVPLVAHAREQDAAREQLARAAAQVAAAGGELVVAALVADPDWGRAPRLDPAGWARTGANLDALAAVARAEGTRLVLHPHTGTLLETADDVRLALVHTDVPWCLDTGHLLLGGTDPVAFARDHAGRVGHVHLKDVDARLAERYRTGEIDFLAATRAGLFQPLGRGDVALEAVVEHLEAAGYDGWYVLEQDLMLDDASADPASEVRRSLEWLRPELAAGRA